MLLPISPVQNQSGGFLSKIGGLGGAVGGLIGAGVGAFGANPGSVAAGFKAGQTIGGLAGGALQAVSPGPKLTQSSQLQSVSGGLDSQALKLTQAIEANNQSNAPKPDRLSVNQHLTQALNDIQGRMA